MSFSSSNFHLNFLLKRLSNSLNSCAFNFLRKEKTLKKNEGNLEIEKFIMMASFQLVKILTLMLVSPLLHPPILYSIQCIFGTDQFVIELPT